MVDGSGRILVLVVAACLVVGVWAVVREAQHPAGHDVRWLRLASGLSLMAVAIAGGNYVIRQEPDRLVEARGYGVVVEGVAPSADRGFDVGLALAQSVKVDTCDPDDLAEVTLQIAPTAEFWIDNHPALGDSTQVSVLIPAAEAALTKVSQGRYGMDPYTRPADDLSETVAQPDLTSTQRRLGDDLVVDVTLARWAAEREPLRITYTARIVQRHGLGSCFVDLPALTGLPTVISGATLEGLARDDVDDLTASGQEQGLFIVSTAEVDEDDEGDEGDERYAYYDPRFEITRGVTVLDLPRGLTEDESRPTPNANFSGSPGWTCRSTVASDRRFMEDEAEKRAEAAEGGSSTDEEPFFTTSRENEGTYALSRSRIDEVLEQKDCAAQARLEEASAGSKRDVVVMFVGALFSAGVAWASTSVRRRKVAPVRGTTAAAGTSRGPSPATRRMLATIARARRRLRGRRPHDPPDVPPARSPED